jgi:hypothetical protein
MTLNTYQITAWCDRTFTSSFDVEAKTPAHALKIARQQVHDEEAEECDSRYRWDTFRVCDAADNELLTCCPPHGTPNEPHGEPIEIERLRLTTSTLLDALKIAQGFVQWASDHGADQAATANALTFMRSAIAGAEVTDRIAPRQPVRFAFTRARGASRPGTCVGGKHIRRCHHPHGRRDRRRCVREGSVRDDRHDLRVRYGRK